MRDKHERTPMRVFAFFLIFVLFIVAFFGLRNFKQKRKHKKMQVAPYIYKAEELAKIARKKDAGIKVVLNEEVGLWDKQGNKKIELIPDLAIGGSNESDTNKAFYRPGLVIGKNGFFYVAQMADGIIKKFDKDGNYLLTIGKKGQGPGELSFPFQFDIDEKDTIRVYSAQRITLFNSKGKFLSCFQIDKQIGLTYTFHWTGKNYYFSSFDPENEKVIHIFDQTGQYIKSFGESIIFRSKITRFFLDTPLRVAFGYCHNYKNKLYFSRRNPYEIHIYNLYGKLETKIFRKYKYMKPDHIIFRGEWFKHGSIPETTLLYVWNDFILNYQFTLIIKNNKGINEGILDIFSLSGQLLTTLKISENIRFFSCDPQGNLYGIKNRDLIPEVVRYKLKIL